MEKIIFSNNGTIDERMWSTFGVSAKDSEYPIGQFGTGLKYAIAILMREKRNLTIESGNKIYVFGYENAKIRNKDFDIITCNGKHLPFTTNLGSKWELWQAYRELYSNCLDEGGWIGDGGETKIIAEIGDVNINDVYLKRDNKIDDSDYSEIYSGESNRIYFKNFRVMDLNPPSKFTYNLKIADLTEDRTLKYPAYDINRGVSETIIQSKNEKLIEDFLLRTKSFYEKDSIGFEHTDTVPSEKVIQVFQKFKKRDCYLHEKLSDKIKRYVGYDKPNEIKPNEYQSKIIEKSVNFLRSIDCIIPYEIILTKDLRDNVLAMASLKEECIYLSDTVLIQGSKKVAAALYEENLHLQKGLIDCTYQMQSYLFEQIITMGEKLTGEIL